MLVALTEAISATLAVVLALSTQSGTEGHGFAKFMAQDVTAVPTTVMVPLLSFPTLEELLPHVPSMGTGPEVIWCP